MEDRFIIDYEDDGTPYIWDTKAQEEITLVKAKNMLNKLMERLKIYVKLEQLKNEKETNDN